MHSITLSKTKFIIYKFISNNIFVYIVDNKKLTIVNKNTIALEEILLNDIIIISNFIDVLHILNLLINLLSINTLTKREKNVNFYNNKYCIIAFNNKQILYAISIVNNTNFN